MSDKLPFFALSISPGLVGALASGLFVSKSTWTSRGVGFLAGEAVAVSGLIMIICGGSGGFGRGALTCLAQVPGALTSFVLGDSSK